MMKKATIKNANGQTVAKFNYKRHEFITGGIVFLNDRAIGRNVLEPVYFHSTLTKHAVEFDVLETRVKAEEVTSAITVITRRVDISKIRAISSELLNKDIVTWSRGCDLERVGDFVYFKSDAIYQIVRVVSVSKNEIDFEKVSCKDMAEVLLYVEKK